MGMFDRIWVCSKNPFHLPPGEWQTKDLDNGLCEYRIDRKGRLIPISKKNGDGYQITGEIHEKFSNSIVRAIDIRAYCSPAHMDYILHVRCGIVIKIYDQENVVVYDRFNQTYLNVNPLRRLWEMYLAPHVHLSHDYYRFRCWQYNTIGYKHIYQKIKRLLKQPNGNLRAHRYLDRILVSRMYP